jgi:carboxyl-terminal processing protease
MSIPLLILVFFLHISYAQDSCSREALSKLKEVISEHYLWKDRIDGTEWGSLDEAIAYLRNKGDRWTAITNIEEDRLWYSKAKMLGIGIRWDDEGTIKRVFKDSPAERSGLKEGDLILSVNGAKEKNLWSQTIRSVPVGSIINITVKRQGSLKEFHIVKGEFSVPPVEEVRIILLDHKKIGYIALTNFTNPAVEEFRKALEFLNAQGVDALLLDLRDNGGGLISAAKSIADMFIRGKGVMFYLEGRNRAPDVYPFKEGEPLFKKPVLVFVNRWTASAAELLTVLLKVYDRAVIAGELTVGKYVGSNMYKLDDCGKVLRLVTFSMKLPNGENITDDVGIMPDCVIKAKNDEGLSMALDCLLTNIFEGSSLAQP